MANDMSEKFRFLIYLALMFLALQLACSGGSKEEPQLGGELRLRLESEPRSLDPNLASNSTEVTIANQLFRGLLWFDEKLNLVPMAAKEVPTVKNGGISPDGLVYTFRLRDDLTWSDGVALTAGDFEYSLKRLLDPRTRSPSATGFFGIRGAERFRTAQTTSEQELEALRQDVGVRAGDEHTLIITVETPRPALLQSMTSHSVRPLRRDIIEKFGDDWTKPENIVSNGPFVLKEFVRGDRLVLEPNRHWWGAEKPKLARLTLSIMPDGTAAYNSYIEGGLDLVDIPSDLADTVEGDASRKNERITRPLASTPWILMLNSALPPFDNVKVRQAFSLAFDREAFVEKLMRGSAEAGYSLIPPGLPGHDKKLGVEWRFNPEKAKKLLAEAGYPDGAGLPAIAFPWYDALTESWARFVQEEFARNLNVKIDLQPLENVTVFRTKLTAGGVQMRIFSSNADYPDPANLLVATWTCERYEGAKCAEFGTSNYARYANKEFDSLMQRAQKEPDTQRRLNLYTAGQELLVEDAASIFVAYRFDNSLKADRVRNMVLTPLDRRVPGQFFLERVYIAQK